jgi:hypothetical protein
MTCSSILGHFSVSVLILSHSSKSSLSNVRQSIITADICISEWCQGTVTSSFSTFSLNPNDAL